MKITRLFIMICVIIASFCITSSAKTHKADILPDDIIEYTLEEEDKLSAELLIDEPGLYNVKVTEMSTTNAFTPKIAVSVHHKSDEIYRFETKKPLYSEEEFNTNKFTFLIGLTEGEYKLEIENLTRASDVTFKIETSFTPEENIETSCNNSFENATTMDTGTKYFGGAVMSDEIDCFKFEMPYDGVSYIQMYSPEAKMFSLYDADKNEIGSIGIKIDEADKIYELRSGLTKGTYYISVQPDEDYCNPLYTIKVETSSGDYFEKEYNNDKDNAMSIESGKEYQGNLFGIHDIDTYTFTLSEKSTVTLDFTDTIASKDKHYKMLLSGSDYMEEFEGGRVSKALSLEKGTYYFTVKNFDKDSFTSMIYKVKIRSDKGFAKAESEETPENIPEDMTEEITEQFAVVTQDKWYYDEILEAKKLGLINGMGDNLFKPDENVSVAEIITMAVRIKNTKDGANTEITNSPVGKWYNSYITFAVNTGLIKTDDFDSFERNATRSEVAYIFANIFENVESDKNTIISDVDESTKYCDEIHKLFDLGILNGDGNGKFRPDDGITRAEAAAILLRVHKAL